jgi:hypothetical protein
MKLIDNTKIDLEILSLDIKDGIMWSYKCSKSVKITLNNKGVIYVNGEVNSSMPNDIFEFYLDYSQADDLLIDIDDKYKNGDEKYDSLYEKYENGELEHDDLLNYIESEHGSKYDEEELSTLVKKEKENFLAKLHDYIVWSEVRLMNILSDAVEVIEESYGYIIIDELYEIYDDIKEKLDYKDIGTFDKIMDYMIENHGQLKEEYELEKKLYKIIEEIIENIEEDNEYLIIDIEYLHFEIYEGLKSEFEDEELDDESLIRTYIINNHTKLKEEEY